MNVVLDIFVNFRRLFDLMRHILPSGRLYFIMHEISAFELFPFSNTNSATCIPIAAWKEND